MQPDDHRRHAVEAGERIRALAGGDLTIPVPACPDYDLRRLVVHCGYFCRFVTTAIETGGPPEYDRPEHRDHDPGEWFSTGFDHLVATLSAIDPAAEVWTWGHDRTAAFWMRRAAQELSVHRWDAEDAVGEADPIDAALAADGVDEFLDEFVPHRGVAAKFGGEGETLHLHATDVDGVGRDGNDHGEWLVTARPDRFDVEHTDAKGDVAARGTASDLLLFLWGRVPPERLDVFGDGSLLTRWQARIRL